MTSYEEMDVDPYRFTFTIRDGSIVNVDVSKTDLYMGDITDYYDIMTTNKNRVYDADGRRLRGNIFKDTIVFPPINVNEEDIMDVNNPYAIAYPTGMVLYCDIKDFDDNALEYLSMLLYDYATMRSITNTYTKYILDKGYPRKELNWN